MTTKRITSYQLPRRDYSLAISQLDDQALVASYSGRSGGVMALAAVAVALVVGFAVALVWFPSARWPICVPLIACLVFAFFRVRDVLFRVHLSITQGKLELTCATRPGVEYVLKDHLHAEDRVRLRPRSVAGFRLHEVALLLKGSPPLVLFLSSREDEARKIQEAVASKLRLKLFTPPAGKRP